VELFERPDRRESRREFLFKDIVLLCVCVVLFLASLPQSVSHSRSAQTVQVGAQRIIREVLFPQTRREFGDPGSGVLRDALDVDFSILTTHRVSSRVDCRTQLFHDRRFLPADVATNCYCAT